MTASPLVRSYLLDPLERACATFTQQLVVLLVATGSAGLLDHHQAWALAADTAAFAAAISLLTSLLTFGVPKLNPDLDLVLRVLKTGLQSFLGVLTAAAMPHSFVHADWRDALTTAVPVAAAALLKGLAASSLPWSDGASLLPTGLGPILPSQLDYGPVPTVGMDALPVSDAVILPPHSEASLGTVSTGAHAAKDPEPAQQEAQPAAAEPAPAEPAAVPPATE